MARANFTKTAKRIITLRSGGTCSFPGCGRLLIGQGKKADETLTIGECAHIYAAAGQGPRANGALTAKQLESPENGIFLCPQHHTEIDQNSTKYPAELLIQYKAKHEFDVSMQIGDIAYPALWIRDINISPIVRLFPSGMNLHCAKVNVLYGTNGSGKTTIIEQLTSAFSGKLFDRWKTTPIDMDITMDNPVVSSFNISIKSQNINYNINGTDLPLCPYNLKVFHLRDPMQRTPKPDQDDFNQIAWLLNLPRDMVRHICLKPLKDTSFVDSTTCKTIRRKPYLIEKLLVHRKNFPTFLFQQLSGTEQIRTILDILISFITDFSKYHPVLFLRLC